MLCLLVPFVGVQAATVLLRLVSPARRRSRTKTADGRTKSREKTIPSTSASQNDLLPRCALSNRANIHMAAITLVGTNTATNTYIAQRRPATDSHENHRTALRS